MPQQQHDVRVAQLRQRLDGRTKRELIEGMIVRSPHQAAADKMIMALDVFPQVFLMLAHDFPTKVWIVDRGEPLSSAGILTERMRHRRWHHDRVGIDDCDGLTDAAPGYIAIAVSWKTLHVMRHEFAHAMTTFFSPRLRLAFTELYRLALQRQRFTEPLAAESLGEYVACAVSDYFAPNLREELRERDAHLYALVDGFITHAARLSEMEARPE